MNILWTNELQKHLDMDGVPIITLSIHPGAMNTFADRLPMFQTVGKVIMGLFFKTWDQDAYNSIIGAVLPTVRENPEKYKAAYIEGDYGKVVKLSELTRNDEAAAALWKTTENFVCGLDIYWPSCSCDTLTIICEWTSLFQYSEHQETLALQCGTTTLKLQWSYHCTVPSYIVAHCIKHGVCCMPLCAIV